MIDRHNCESDAREFDPNYNSKVRNLIEKCTSRNRDERPKPLEIIEELDQVREGIPIKQAVKNHFKKFDSEFFL